MLRIEPVSRTVTVGPASDLATASVRTATPVWCGPVPELPAELVAQYRAHGSTVPCTVAPADADLDVSFADRQSGVAPGQTIAFYDGDRVVGSATIATTTPAPSAVGAVR